MTIARHIMLTVGLGLFSSSLLAQQPYWHDTSGKVVRDGFGGCVQTVDWRPELATVECGAAAPAAAPVSTTTAPSAPAAAPAPTQTTAETAAPVASTAAIAPMSLRGDASFALGSDQLSPAAREELDQMAKQIQAMASIDSIEVAGHTDNRGAAALNQALSERRAAAVKRYLVEQGVDGSKINAVGYGFSRPIADNNTAAGRAQNRRVEITIQGVR